MNISQEELAHNLGVSFQSVNRWENGKYEPTKLAKTKLDELFAKYHIDNIEE
ncbi:helix-turn-helix transcriptional regulator [Metamycoplasma equirhinis]